MPSRRKDSKDPKDPSVPTEPKEFPTDRNFTKNQAVAFQAMAEGKNIFLTGPAGGGKSYLIENFRREFPNKKIAVTATTGIAAVGIGGTTLHSFLGLGITRVDSNQLTKKILKTPYLRDRWRKIEVLIIDEISMLSPDLFDTLEATARAVRCGPISLLRSGNDVYNYERRTIHNQPVFGGIQLVLTGDYLQLPCPKEDRFCYESATWNICVEKTVYLGEIMRQKDPAFQKILNELRVGEVSSETKKVLKTRENVELKNDFGIKPTKVNMTNAEVDYVNEQELDLLAEDGRDFFEYTMEIEFYGRVDNYNTAMEKIRKNCLAPQKLQLCEGAQVLLLKNLDMEAGLANGSRGVVVRFDENFPVVKFMNGEEREIGHGSWDFYEGERKCATAVQIPLKVAYAISCHKCVSANTIICTDLGMVRISELWGDDTETGWKELDVNVIGRFGFEKATQIYRGNEEKSIKITTQRGFSLEGSEIHPILVYDNRNEIWKKLPEIKLGDSVVLKTRIKELYTDLPKVFDQKFPDNNLSFDKVVKIEPSVCCMFDLHVPKTHSFVSNGFISHNCQGLTLDLAEVDLGTVFEYGQAYVGLSRIRNLEGLSIKNLSFSKIQAHPKSVEFYRKLLEETNEELPRIDEIKISK